VDVKLLVEFVKTLLEHSNAMVRSSATKTVTKIFTFVGEAIKEHLGDVKPALMTTIEKEFAKYANAKPDPPTKFYRQKEAVVAPIEEEEEEEPEPEPVAEEPAAVELVEPAPASVRTTTSAAPSRATSRPAPAAGPAPVDDGWVEGSIDEYDDGQQEENAPPARADVTPLLTPALFAELADPKDWKRRKEALDKIRRILSEANMRVQSGCLALLMPKLNARLKDTNKNLVLYTVKLLGLLATAVGREIEGQMKLTVPLILANYTDQKQTMRDTVAKTLDQWAAEVGPDAFVPFFPPAVAIESSSARKDALAWLVAHKQDLGIYSDYFFLSFYLSIILYL
jgi:cytoskeleton-associated protein 5